MENKNFKVNAVVEVTAQQVSDQLITAFEGGIGYWCCIVNDIFVDAEKAYKEFAEAGIDSNCPNYGILPLVDNAALLLCDTEEYAEESMGENFEIWMLDKSAIERGLHVMAVKDPEGFRQIVEETGDAETADSFVQYCLFGELVYG